MKKNAQPQENHFTGIRCNQCGKEIKMQNGYAIEGVLPVKYQWGYFSNKDGQIHQFNLCESCYDAWIENFKIPVEKSEALELLSE